MFVVISIKPTGCSPVLAAINCYLMLRPESNSWWYRWVFSYMGLLSEYLTGMQAIHSKLEMGWRKTTWAKASAANNTHLCMRKKGDGFTSLGTAKSKPLNL